jgi:hypothetical protein
MRRARDIENLAGDVARLAVGRSHFAGSERSHRADRIVCHRPFFGFTSIDPGIGTLQSDMQPSSRVRSRFTGLRRGS